ncbi:hypothetical protein [Flavobacterium sp. HSC-61S13]|uniref:hypothetical protein n=1 Tax=Flavobacterium sp. HSC-61S13 TaxID=2910963 RepID=UPI00209E6626|nr:hypothetical protein [Flavobacterium sp. HSC-61S13]MCP1996574.1 hypothetical protein [Flavobacterium sp. HSC-61S13]
MPKKLLFIFFFTWLTANTVFAQTPVVVKDSTKVFENIEDYSKKRKVTKFVHKLIFRKNKKNTKSNIPEIEVDRNLELGQGKIIRNINITTLDPFGLSESDSSRTPSKKIETLGNRLHLKTKSFTIRNLLIFKKNQRFDSLVIKESERIIRTQRYVRRVLIRPIPIANSPDSVDVSIRVLDSWSIYPTGSLSSSTGRIQLIDRNFGGFGHEFSNQYKMRFNENKKAYNTQYRINNISNTFISTNLYYDSDLEENYIKSWNIERPFYSPYAKWAGGAQFYQRFYRDSLPDAAMKYSMQNFKYNIKDFWAGYSIPVSRKFGPENEITNLVTSFRYFRQKYTERPTYEYDTLAFYSNQRLYLASVGISSVNYVQDKFIYNYDIIEDVQVGKLFAITGGLQEIYGKRRSYFGAKFALGKYTRYGYFSTNIEWGSYFFGKNPEQSAFKIEVTYFTKLMHWGDWRFRHFIRPQLIMGYNRLKHVGDELRIDSTTGIEGFNAEKLRGTKRAMLSYQIQSYAPTNWNGFRFNPYFNVELGMLGDENNRFLQRDLYTKIGVGVVINNDYLVFSSIQLSLAYYPSMPDRDGSVIKTNVLRNHNFSLPNFNYGKPTTVSYR